MQSLRIEKINRELLREISELLRSRIKDPDARKAVLTAVDCSRDISQAKVYFTTLDSEEREQVRRSLGKAAGILRSLLGKQMRLRQIPRLMFMVDETEERAKSIDAILDRLRHEERPAENGESQ